jgi:signal transduction histidine kinase
MDATKRFLLTVDGWGRWVADPKAFLVVAPFWLVFSLLGVPNIGSPRVLVVAIVANTIALAGCYGLLLLSRVTVFSGAPYRRISVVSVVAVGAIIGAAKAVMTVSLIALGIPDPSYFDALPSRMLAAASTGAWLLPVLALFLTTRDRFLTERETLLRELTTSAYSPSPDFGGSVGTVASDVRRFADRALEDMENHSTPSSLRRYLRTSFQPQLQKITRQLMTDPATLMAGSSFLDLVAATIRSRSYPLQGVAIAHIVLTAPFVFFQVGLTEELGRVVISTGLLVFTLWLAKTLPAGGFTMGLTILVGGLVVWNVANELLAFVLFGPFGDIPFWLTAFANFTVALSHTVLLGAMRVATDQRKTIRSHLDTLLTEKYWQKDIDTLQSLHQRRALAQQLHGQLQSILLATLTRLKKNPEATDGGELKKELVTLSRQLSGTEQPSSATTVTLSRGLTVLSQRWEGILEVAHDTSGVSAFLSPEDVRTIIDVAEESVSNAVRHGMATAIDITIAAPPSRVSVIASDNGIGPRLGEPGVGSLLYSSLPGAEWSLTETADQSGAILEISWTTTTLTGS